ncbi:hypothetical protein [Streptomyces sp. NPDC057250]|uniref:hypothetical protein n=1 Tax=Streptomyces sp. NPDC057250 TaxID=3346068 RepID=UPI003636622A
MTTLTLTPLTPLTPHQVHAALLLAQRLVERHDLTPTEAFIAVDQTRRGETGPHTHLVTTEAAALLAEATAPVRAMLDALRPITEAAARTMAELTRALAPVTNGRSDRPAWISPYGPPPRRR